MRKRKGKDDEGKKLEKEKKRMRRERQMVWRKGKKTNERKMRERKGKDDERKQWETQEEIWKNERKKWREKWKISMQGKDKEERIRKYGEEKDKIKKARGIDKKNGGELLKKEDWTKEDIIGKKN